MSFACFNESRNRGHNLFDRQVIRVENDVEKPQLFNTSAEVMLPETASFGIDLFHAVPGNFGSGGPAPCKALDPGLR
jgi:hypothetical protein